MSQSTNWGVGSVCLAAALTVVWFVPPLAVLLVLVGLIFVTVRVTVRDEDVVITLGLGGLFRLHIRRDDVAGVEVIDVRPLRYGGWGLRLIRGGWAVVIRGGPGLAFDLKDGRRRIVTVDDPRAVLAALS